MKKSVKNRANLSLLGQVERGNGKVDRRLRGFRAAKAAERRLVADLGGADAVSAQKAAVVSMAAREIALLEMLDAGLLRFPSATGKRRRAFLAMVAERDRLAGSLTRHLRMVGLERAQEAETFNDYLDRRAREREQNGNTGSDDRPDDSGIDGETQEHVGEQ